MIGKNPVADVVRGMLGSPSKRPSSGSQGCSKKKGDCACEGMCKACGWDKKRVPTAWRTQGPGTRYDGKSPLIGKEVTLHNDARPSKIVATATPLGETIFQTGRRSDRYRCQGSFIIRTPFGNGAIETPVPKSVVRERMRVNTREGNCPDAALYTGASMRGFTGSMEREAMKVGQHPFARVGDLPFPHRKGSTPCCNFSKITPEALEALVATWRESGEESDFFTARDAIRRALPKAERATASLDTFSDLVVGIKAVRDHCWSQWLEHENRITEPSKTFKARVKANRKAMVAQGLPLTGSLRRRRLVASADLKPETEEETAARRAREGGGSMVEAFEQWFGELQPLPEFFND